MSSDASPQLNSPRRAIVRRAAAGPVIAVVALAITFGAAEMVTRAFFPPHNLGRIVGFDPVLGWRLLPGASMQVVDRARGLDYGIEINSLGYRERAVLANRGDSRRRILFIGDSVTFGSGVDADLRMSAFVGRALGDGTEVINAGVPGWGTDQEVLAYEARDGDLGADLVVLTFFMPNDVINNAMDHLFLGEAPKPRFTLRNDSLVSPAPLRRPTVAPRHRARNMLRRSRFLVAMKRRVGLLRSMRRGRPSRVVEAGSAMPVGFSRPSDAWLSHWSVYERNPSPAIEDAWRVTGRLIGRLASDCRARGAELIVFAFPLMEADDHWRSWLVERSGVDASRLDFEAPYRRLESICRDADVPLVHPLGEFRRASRTHTLYFEHDGHPNAAGHAVAARALLRNLSARYAWAEHSAAVEVPSIPRR